MNNILPEPEFLKWWTSADVQVLFDRELESLMGSAEDKKQNEIRGQHKIAGAVLFDLIP